MNARLDRNVARLRVLLSLVVMLGVAREEDCGRYIIKPKLKTVCRFLKAIDSLSDDALRVIFHKLID